MGWQDLVCLLAHSLTREPTLDPCSPVIGGLGEGGGDMAPNGETTSAAVEAVGFRVEDGGWWWWWGVEALRLREICLLLITSLKG